MRGNLPMVLGVCLLLAGAGRSVVMADGAVGKTSSPGSTVTPDTPAPETAAALTFPGLIRKGVEEGRLGNYDVALSLFFEALSIGETTGEQRKLAEAKLEIGWIHRLMREDERAVRYLDEALHLFTELQHSRGEAYCYNNLGLIEARRQNSEAALRYLNLAVAKFTEVGHRSGLYMAQQYLGKVYAKLNQPDRAEQLFKRSLETSRMIEDANGTADALNSLAEVQLSRRQFDSAQRNLIAAAKVATDAESKEALRTNHRLYSDLHTARGDFESALAHFQQFNRLEREIFDERKTRQVTQLQAWYENEAKEARIEALERENDIQRVAGNLKTAIGVGTGVLLALLAFFLVRYYRARLAHEETRQNAMQVRSKLNNLQRKVNPHFLFNTLSSIIQVGYEENPSKLEQLVHNLAELYRKVLYLPDDLSMPLSEELGLIENYLEIEKIRLGDRLQIDISIPPEHQSVNIPPLMIETLVENAIIHGIAPKESGGRVTIASRIEQRRLVVEVADDGVGFDPESSSRGFGLASVEQRLRLFYKNQASFQVSSTAQTGTTVRLAVPVG